MCLCIYLQDSCPLCLYFLIFFIFWCAQDVSGSHPSSSGWVPPAINTLQVKSGLCTDVSPFRWHHYHSVKGTATLQKRRGDFYFIKLTLHYITCSVYQQQQVAHVSTSDYMWVQWTIKALSFSLFPLEPDTLFYVHIDLVRLEPL